MSEPQYRCSACGDQHGLSEREERDGRRLCPECGHHVAEPIDVGVDSPR